MTYELRPFRVEWRENLTTRWLLIESSDTRPVADALARDARARFGGYTRIIRQRVVEESS